ncbi:MAG: hypothetical protein M3Y37_10735, partial [Chloroflexota bacterium]|nr:hypothetical protein [Chloroflexota bacterium]
KDPSRRKTAALDWEFWDIEPGFNDLAAFIALNWFADMRRERELDLVRRYRDQLASRGIDLTWEQCRDGYRLAVVKHVLTPVKQQVNGLQVRSWWVNLQRIVTAYIDLDCRELIARL